MIMIMIMIMLMIMKRKSSRQLSIHCLGRCSRCLADLGKERVGGHTFFLFCALLLLACSSMSAGTREPTPRSRGQKRKEEVNGLAKDLREN
jgi:hypothetical protein